MLRDRLVVCNFWKTEVRFCRCWSLEWEYTMISSMYRANPPISSPKTFSIKHWKVAAAFHNLNDMHLNSNRLREVMKTIFCLLLSSMAICQYPDCRSRALNQVTPSNDSRISWIIGIGWASGRVLALSFHKSIQNHSLPSGRSTITTGDCEDSIMSSASICLTCSSVVIFFRGDILVGPGPDWYFILKLDDMFFRGSFPKLSGCDCGPGTDKLLQTNSRLYPGCHQPRRSEPAWVVSTQKWGIVKGNWIGYFCPMAYPHRQL